jgi:hypothetical protein
MQRFFLIFLLFSILNACQLLQSDPLDKPFEITKYRKHLGQLMEKEAITENDYFLMNYAIIRQRPFFNYDLKGQTYGDVLAFAKKAEQEGLGIPTTFNENGEQDVIEVKVTPEEGGLVRVGESKRMFKALKFSAFFKNTTNKDIALMTTSFVINGPFKEHITTVGYEVNCKVPKGTQLEIGFLVDARDLRKNILYQGNVEADFLMVDNLLNEIQAVPSGLSYTAETAFYDECLFGGTRLSPKNVFLYNERLGDMDWNKKDGSGKTVELHYGNAHFLPENKDEPISIDELR